MFYRHLVRDMPWGKPTMLVFGAVFAVTFCGSIISTFVECAPLHLYWQVVPDPGMYMVLYVDVTLNSL